MRRVVGLLPGGQMASGIPAVRQQGRQAVIVIDVAGSAGRHLAAVGHEGVRVCQREPERGVIELAVGPLSDGVALGAGSGRRGEARLDVIRHIAAERRRGVPRRLVAAHTVRRVQCVIVADVAGSAGRGRRRSMRARQRETGGAVVERSGVPAFRGMASRTIRRRKSRPRGRVYRCGGLLPSRQMASGVAAVVRHYRQSVVVVDMARSTRHVGVPVGQQEARLAVIEARRGPGNGVVAPRAVGHAKSRPCRGVHRIIRLLPSRQVAAGIAAVRRGGGQIVIVVDVAGGTGHIGMAIRQQEPGGAVVELRAQPAVKSVAGVAGGRELCTDVIRIRGLLKVLQVAGSAGRRQALELAHCRSLVAVFALHGGVSAEKREAILVILNLLNGIVPTENRVALRAVRAHFPLVNIGVAILTILAHVCEYRFYVALRALNFLMHAAERISCFIVIKFRDGADGAPASSGVAVLAGDGQRSVRTARGLPLRCGYGSARCRPREEQQATQDLNGLRRNGLPKLQLP